MKDYTTGKLKKKLDTIFSRYIRQRDKFICYTCGRVMDMRTSQCGHFNPRQYLNTRWDERNNHCQCYACNMLYNGQPSRYAQHLIEDFGEGIINELERDRLISVKLDRAWYEAQIDKYTTLLSSIE